MLDLHDFKMPKLKEEDCNRNFIAGANKLVKDLNAGLDRVRFVAAQMNNIKYGSDLACNISGICKECRSDLRNCNITSIIHKKPVDSDFHVIIIGEELGF